MSKYLHTLSIASVTGTKKYAYYFRNRAKTLDYSNAKSLNHFYKGFIGKSIKSGKFINTKVIDTPSRLVNILSSFSESQWLGLQGDINSLNLNAGRDLFNPNVKKNPPAIQLDRQPTYVASYQYMLGTTYSFKPYLNYLFQTYEYTGIARAFLGNYASSPTANINLKQDRTRYIGFNFINYATNHHNGDDNLYTGNINFEIYENSATLTNLNAYLTSRYSRYAISPKVISNGAALSGNLGRFFCCSIVSDMPEPNESIDYLEGAGLHELFCGFINVSGNYTAFKINLQDEQYFYTEAWQDNLNEWQKNTYGQWPTSNKLIGLLPNILGEPIPIMLKDSIVLYISGVRGHYSSMASEQGSQPTIKAQTAVAKLTFPYLKDYQMLVPNGKTELIEHDASGSPDNYEELGGTDSDYWNIYHTLWGSNVGDHAVVLVNVTKHKRYQHATSNFLGNSVQDSETDIETFIHIYIDDEVLEFDCKQLGFYPEIKSSYVTMFSNNIFDKRYPDNRSVLISVKFGTVISNEDVLFCFTSLDKKKRLLVKFNITNRTFTTIREDSADDGLHVATCYQRQVFKDGKELTPSCIIYRIGVQGSKGKVFISKDTGKTWHKIADSPYTTGGGMYYLGNEYYAINYGKAF